MPVGGQLTLGRQIQVDGSGRPEFLRLEFNEKVQLQKAFFTFAGPFEKFGLAIDGQMIDVGG